MADPTYDTAIYDLEEALKTALRAYAKWHTENWNMSKEQADKEFNDPPKSQDYWDGYSAGIESTLASIDFFLDERS